MLILTIMSTCISTHMSIHMRIVMSTVMKKNIITHMNTKDVHHTAAKAAAADADHMSITIMDTDIMDIHMRRRREIRWWHCLTIC